MVEIVLGYKQVDFYVKLIPAESKVGLRLVGTYYDYEVSVPSSSLLAGTSARWLTIINY